MGRASTPPGKLRIRWREILSYGSGSVASNLAWNMVAAYLIAYYTDVALLPVAAVGSLVLLARCFDAVIDPAAGIIVDRTRTRFGKARPYLLFASIPFTLLCILTFWVPQVSVGLKLLYAYATFTLLGAAYSFVYVPYGAMQPLLTDDGRQMLQLSSVRAMGTSAASVFVYALMLPMVALFGGQARGYRDAAIVFAVLTMLLYWVTFFNCRERVALPSRPREARIGRSVAQMMRNKIWWIAVVFELLIFVRLGMLAPAMVFYAREVLHAPALASVLLPVMSVAILSGGLVAPLYLSRLGKRRGMYALLVFTMPAFVLMALMHAHLAWVLVFFFLGTFGNGIQATMIFSMVTEAVDWQEAFFGQREEGLLASSTAFTQKVGFALGGALLAYSLAFVGYDPHQLQPIVQTTPIWLVAGVPIAVALLQLLCIRFYDFDGRDPRQVGAGQAQRQPWPSMGKAIEPEPPPASLP